ncbi:MAG: methyltransferase domain-containing protein [Candidatus Rokubacteria bacterium]|nr:methyltransferase domain-containing protein [Candidatus Rokubacteria bacterium]
MSTPREQLLRLVEYVRGFRATYLAAAGVRLGVFKKLAGSPGMTAEALAGELGLHPAALSVWCRTAYALGFLEADEAGRLRLAPGFDQVLGDPASPWYYGGALGLTVDFEADDLSRLEEVLRTGKAVPFQARGVKFSEQVGAATAGLHTLVARKVLPGVPEMEERLHRGLRLLDVGCGCGGFLLALAQAFPAGKYVGVDIDRKALGVARKAVKAAGLSRRLKFRAAGEDGLGVSGPFDVITLLQVLHEIRPELRLPILRECARVSARDCQLVILDETYPSTWAELRRAENMRPVMTAFSELSMGNVIPTREEQESLLAAAGFTLQGRTLVGDGFTLLTAQRAG